MANQENLIRPVILNPQQQQELLPKTTAQQAALQEFLPIVNAQQAAFQQELLPKIGSMIESAINDQMRNSAFFPSNTGVAREILVDDQIEERFRGELSEADKIPDVVRYIREFSGNPSEFSSWRKSVERILDIYAGIRGTPRYFGILNVIRNKINAEADIVLESHNTPLNWEAISKCLTLHYKRDIGTLEYQLMSLVQGNNPIEEFYRKVYSHLSLILNKIACMEIDNHAITLLTKTYRDKAMDTFIRGLNGDLPKLLAIREPENLPQALQLCQKLANLNYRNNYAQNSFRLNSRAPPLPPKRQMQPTQQHQYQQQQYQLQRQYYPQHQY